MNVADAVIGPFLYSTLPMMTYTAKGHKQLAGYPCTFTSVIECKNNLDYFLAYVNAIMMYYSSLYLLKNSPL